jgi:hypothetical protein
MLRARSEDTEIADRAEELYEQRIRAQLEPQFDGKIIVIDAETGDYEVDDVGLSAAHRLRARRPEAELYARRIGHDISIQFTDGGLVTIEPL